MPIDLSQVDPLKPKKALLEAAMAHQQRRNGMPDAERMAEDIPPDLQWLVEDKKAVHDLVRQMDTSIGELARQLRQAETVSRNGSKQLEAQQKLLYKQIRTLNGLMKRQIEAFELINKKVQRIHISEQTVLPQLAMGLVGGLVAGITVAVTLPWVQLLMARLTQ